MSAFLLKFKANYLEKNAWLPHFSQWISIALAKIYFFHVVLTWGKNLCIYQAPTLIDIQRLFYARAGIRILSSSVQLDIDHFLKISEDFPKLFRRPDERFQTFSEHFRTFSDDKRRQPKITEDDRGCFDHTSTNLSVAEGTKEKCYQKGMISLQCER